MHTHHGLFSRSHGACPVCGSSVRHTRAFDGSRLRDAYDCYRCGPTVYVARAA